MGDGERKEVCIEVNPGKKLNFDRQNKFNKALGNLVVPVHHPIVSWCVFKTKFVGNNLTALELH